MSTVLPPPGSPDVLYIFDLHCWMHRYYRIMSGGAAHSFAQFVARILREQRPTYVAVCEDLPYPNFRHELSPGVYKAQRPEKDPMLLERIVWAREMLEDGFGIPVYSKRGYEADDLIAWLVTSAKRAGLRSVLVAKDKDLLQLVDGEQVFMWDGKREVWGAPEVEDKFGIRSDQLCDYLAIVGDSSDNVQGVRGLGPAAAVKILRKYGTLEAAIEEVRCKKRLPPYLRKLRDQEDAALFARRLVSLQAEIPQTFNLQELRRA